jgi:glycosyltransferase involved in cell wall biosynthesis
MKILFVTNMYPIPEHKYLGIHVKEQVDYLTKNYPIVSSIFFINTAEKGKLEYIKSIFKIFDILKKNKTDVIHIHYGLSAIFLLFFRPKAKVFLTFHGGDILKEQGNHVQIFISKMAAKLVDKVFILNKEMEGIMKRLNVPYELLPCGVNTDFFINKKELKAPGDSKLILFPGDPSRKVKNFGLFLKVIDILKRKSEYEINFICIHNMTRSEVCEWLNKADCLLMTSFSEGSPQIIKEALSCNLSVVSVPVGDVINVIDGIPFCSVSQDNNPENLADLVISVMQSGDKSIRDAFLKKEIYDNKSVCKKLYENYTNLVKQ